MTIKSFNLNWKIFKDLKVKLFYKKLLKLEFEICERFKFKIVFNHKG